MIRAVIRIFERAAWWHSPRVHHDEAGLERSASWLELFFDLVFVAVIAELSHMLAADISWFGLAGFAVLYAPVWWVWIGATFYHHRFETDDVSHRFFTFLQMIPVVGFAVTVHSGLEEAARGFVWWYVTARVLLIFLWQRAARHNPEMKPVARRYKLGFTVSALLWIWSLAVPVPWRFGFWIAGLIIELVTPMIALRLQVATPQLRSGHLPERFGLFTIIVLGESVLGVINGVAETHAMTFSVLAPAILGLTLAFCLWWIYFDDIVGHRILPTPPWGVLWVYSHLFLTMSLTAIGSAIYALIAHADSALTAPVCLLLCGALASSLVLISVIEFAHEQGVEHDHHDRHERTCAMLRLIGAALILLVGMAGSNFTTIQMLSALVVIMITQVVAGVRARFSS